MAERTATEAQADEAKAEALRRPIWLCADDYGISPAVDRGIRELLMQGHINATSVMVAAPSFDRSVAASLKMLNAGTRRVAIGLHVTLTGPFSPLSKGFRPLRSGKFLPLGEMLVRGTLRLLDRDKLGIEIATQLKAFVTAFGRAPDFIDGHQHVQLFPQVRETFLAVVKQGAPNAWVRQCGRAAALPWQMSDRKALLLDALSRRFRSLAAEAGVKTNPAFAGTYDFNAADDFAFATKFPDFLNALPPQGLVMCHPGFVDAELERLDPLTKLREHEYEYLADRGFPEVLRENGVTLA